MNHAMWTKAEKNLKMTSTFDIIINVVIVLGTEFQIEKRSIIIQLRCVTRMNQLIWIIARGTHKNKKKLKHWTKLYFHRWRRADDVTNAILSLFIFAMSSSLGKQEPNFCCNSSFHLQMEVWRILSGTSCRLLAWFQNLKAILGAARI